jgi:hypothetical protein
MTIRRSKNLADRRLFGRRLMQYELVANRLYHKAGVPQTNDQITMAKEDTSGQIRHLKPLKRPAAV